MKQLVIGITGPFAAGKGILVDLLRQNGFKFYSLSDYLRAVATKNDILLSRENLQDLGNKLRLEQGLDILARNICEMIDPSCQKIIVDSIRNTGEIDYLRGKFGSEVVVVGVDADDDKRKQRYKERALEREEDARDIEKLDVLVSRDRGETVVYGQQVDLCLDLCDHVLINMEDEERFKEDVSDFFERVIEPRTNSLEGNSKRSVEVF